MPPSPLASTVGSVAGALTVLSFIPQAVRVWRTKRTQDLSIGTISLLVAQSIGWTSYGVLLQQPPIIWTNLMVLLIILSILAAKLRHG